MGIERLLLKAKSRLASSLSPYHVGFVQGHAHLSEERIAELRGLLKSGSEERGRETVSEYERRMAALVGDGKGLSFAAGRMAFFALMRALGIGAGDEVLLPGFTCAVVPNAVLRRRAVPVYCDIDPETFGPALESLRSRVSARTKMIVVQHSFGIPCPMAPILEFARPRGIFVVEDCAITLDSAYQGAKVGSSGDATFFSTDHSKPLNTLIGGFLYTRDEALFAKVRGSVERMEDLAAAHQDRLFQQVLFERRHFCPKSYGRAWLALRLREAARRFGGRSGPIFLESDYGDRGTQSYPYPARMPAFLARLGLFELERWDSERRRRRTLLAGYLEAMRDSALRRFIPKAYEDPAAEIVPLRFVFVVNDARAMERAMLRRHVDTGGTWFRKPVIGCAGPLSTLGYRAGSCPVAENLGRRIVNWPCVLPEAWHPRILEIFQQVVSEV